MHFAIDIRQSEEGYVFHNTHTQKRVISFTIDTRQLEVGYVFYNKHQTLRRGLYISQ